MNAPRVGSNTPWGRADDAYEIASGVWEVSTPSHGGIWITPELEATIPVSCQAIARQYAPAGWYEEDCDCVIPLVLLPGIPERMRIQATAAVWHMSERMNPLRCELAIRETARGSLYAKT